MANTNIILNPGDTLNVTAPVVTPIPPNQLPQAAAGTDQTIKLPANEVTLTGVVSDPDGTIRAVKWEKLTGPACTIVSQTSLVTKVTGMLEGVYIFRLSCTDDDGGIAADDLTITVQKADVIVIPPGKVNFMQLEVVGVQDFSGKSGIRFENKRIRNAQDVTIKMYNGAHDIIIMNCFFDGSLKELLETENAYNIRIENCLFARGYTGVYNVASRGIKVINCQFVNMRMRADGATRGQFAQFNSCSEVEISGCKGENFIGESNPEDQVSLYNASNGIVRNNMFRGGGPSQSGGGIMLGDNGGTNNLAELNTLVNPGRYGMAIAGGNNNRILNNKIFSTQNAWSADPLYVWAQGNQVGASSNATVTGNKGNWINRSGSKATGWNSGNIPNTNWQPLADMPLSEAGVPTHLIDMVTPAELLTIRK